MLTDNGCTGNLSAQLFTTEFQKEPHILEKIIKCYSRLEADEDKTY